MKRTLMLIVILTLFVGLFAEKQLSVRDFELQIWQLTNVERQNAGLPLLKYEDGLFGIAKRHSTNMHELGFFAHRDPFGDEVESRKDKYYPELIVVAIGENLGRFVNNSGNFRAREVVDAWMSSPAHKDNILDKEYSHTGVAVVIRDGVMYATQVFATPLAKLTSRIPNKLKNKSKCKLTFEYMADLDVDYFTATLLYPDSKQVFRLNENQEMIGAQPLKPKWLDKKRFQVQVPFLAGQGDYRLCFGFAGNYFPKGIALKVN